MRGSGTGKPERKGKTEMRTLKVPADAAKLSEVTGFVEAVLEECGCSLKTQMQITLAVEEIFVNIAHYAYGEKTGDAEIRVSAADNAVTIVFTDAGKPFDPLQKDDPDLTLPAEERPVGGLGVFLVKKSMDAVSYRYEDGKNILTLTKKIG